MHRLFVPNTNNLAADKRKFNHHLKMDLENPCETLHAGKYDVESSNCHLLFVMVLCFIFIKSSYIVSNKKPLLHPNLSVQTHPIIHHLPPI